LAVGVRGTKREMQTTMGKKKAECALVKGKVSLATLKGGARESAPGNRWGGKKGKRRCTPFGQKEGIPIAKKGARKLTEKRNHNFYISRKGFIFGGKRGRFFKENPLPP